MIQAAQPTPELGSSRTPDDNPDVRPRAVPSALGTAVSFLFSFRVMMAVGLVVVAVMTISNRFNDPDLWFHLKLGQIVWDTHSIPSTDPFSFTAFGHVWTAHEWLAELS